MQNWSNANLCDVANLVLGAFLFFSPWIFGFEAGSMSQNATITGIVIAVLAIGALAAFAVWQERLNLIVGLWTLVSPWVLGFIEKIMRNQKTWSTMAIGLELFRAPRHHPVCRQRRERVCRIT